MLTALGRETNLVDFLFLGKRVIYMKKREGAKLRIT